MPKLDGSPAKKSGRRSGLVGIRHRHNDAPSAGGDGLVGIAGGHGERNTPDAGGDERPDL